MLEFLVAALLIVELISVAVTAVDRAKQANAWQRIAEERRWNQDKLGR